MDWLALFAEFNTEQGGARLYLRIVETIESAIISGAVESEKLPTTRELSAMLGVDRSTVSRAYDELAARNLIASHVGRGTYVKSSQARAAKATSAPAGALDWQSKYSQYGESLLRLMESLPQYLEGDDVISFSGGLPASGSYPQEEFKEILLGLLAADKPIFDFSPSSGEPALRAAVRQHLKGRGVVVPDEELLILSGSQQGIDLVSSIFLSEGDTVVTENPTYFWAIANFKARRCEILGCSLDRDGISLSELESHLRRRSVKFIYVMPTNQNPTGITMSPSRREDLLALSKSYGVPIFEDDFSGDLYYDGKNQPLKAMDRGGNVIYQGTFSKALCPGIRLGWMVAPKEVIDRLSFAKRGSDLSTNSMAQALLCEFLTRGSYDRHLSSINSIYKERRDVLAASLRHYFREEASFFLPPGGLFLWLTLPEFVNSRELLEFALRNKVSVSPGEICYVDNSKMRNTLRLCFIQNDPETIEEGVRRLSLAYFAYKKSVRPAPSAVASDHVLI